MLPGKPPVDAVGTRGTDDGRRGFDGRIPVEPTRGRHVAVGSKPLVGREPKGIEGCTIDDGRRPVEPNDGTIKGPSMDEPPVAVG